MNLDPERKQTNAILYFRSKYLCIFKKSQKKQRMNKQQMIQRKTDQEDLEEWSQGDQAEWFDVGA